MNQLELINTDARKVDGMITAPYQQHSTESREAAEKIAPKINDLQRRVLLAMKELGGACTDNEGMEQCNMNPSTYRPRRVELVKMGLVEKSNERRDGSAVWIAVTA